MQLDLKLYLSGNDSPREEVLEVIPEVVDVDSLDLTVSHPWDHTDRVDVALGSFKCHDVAGDALVFREFTDSAIDLGLAAAGPNTKVGGAISAHNDLRAQTAQAGKTDGTEHAWS